MPEDPPERSDAVGPTTRRSTDPALPAFGRATRAPSPRTRAPPPAEREAAGGIGAPNDLVRALELRAALSGRPATVFAYGDAHELVDLVTYGLATWVGADLAWIDVRLTDPAPSPASPVGLGVIPADRVVVVSRLEEMAPHRPDGRAVRAVIRSDEPLDSLARLSGFVRLPRPLQLAIAKTGPAPIPGVVVVSSAQRLLPLYDPAVLPELLRTVTSLGMSVFASFAGAPPAGRCSFDVVVRVAGDGVERWAEATLELEAGSGLGPGVDAGPVRLGDLHPIREILEAALRGPPTGPR